jgi:ribose 1,5-bisphosphokinase PhnN
VSSEESGQKIGPGCLVLVVGPSGAGKDALLSGARRRLAANKRFLFPRRVVTRPAHAAEDHIPTTARAFSETARRGGFALSWQAHDTFYGILIEVDDQIRTGRIVVANVSRTIVSDAKCRYAHAPVERRISTFDQNTVTFTIDNNGDLEAGVTRLVSVLEATARSQLLCA